MPLFLCMQVLDAMRAANASMANMTAFIYDVDHCVEEASAALLPLLATIQSARASQRPDLPPQQQLLVIFTIFPLDLTPFVEARLKPELKRGIAILNGGLTAVGVLEGT